MLKIVENGVLFKFEQEIVLIEAYGNGIRVRATQNKQFTGMPWALLQGKETKPKITQNAEGACLSNGKITANIDNYGRISFYNQNKLMLLNEQYRCGDLDVDFSNKNRLDEYLFIHKRARQYSRSTTGYEIYMNFDSDPEEKLYGMGQYQNPYLNIKSCSLEMVQLNTQASVPFLLSNKGYGMLWHSPGVGSVNFAKNISQWHMDNAQEIDYWIVAGDSPAEIVEAYLDVVGKATPMPEHALGFWQSKLRYRSQEELLNVAREYHKRNIKLDVLVIDFFHWTNQGDWRFDERYWPDPKAMVEELNSMGIKPMVSVWPTVDRYSENYKELMERDLLIRVEKGLPYSMDFLGTLNFIDITNPEAREFLWQKCKQNYFDYGIDMFWLDVAEPEFYKRDFDIYRYHLGQASECNNIYPKLYAKCFYDGLKAEGVENPLSLIRCAWAGTQTHGALAWSGDVPSSFNQLHNQISNLLNMGLAGIPWWTSDIGGFHGGNINDPYFKELIVRWFQFGCFCPVMRLHGDREPHAKDMEGGFLCHTGAGNEIWSYGKEIEEIFTNYINLRHALKPYIKACMEEASQKGTPMAKPLFYDFPNDDKAWDIEDEYLFGHDILVSPIYQEMQRERSVYLPKGSRWTNPYTAEKHEGGQSLICPAKLEQIPIFIKAEAEQCPWLLQTFKDNLG